MDIGHSGSVWLSAKHAHLLFQDVHALWICLQESKIVAIAAAARSPRVLATTKGPTVQNQEWAQACFEGCNEEVGPKVVGSNPGVRKFFSAKSVLITSPLLHN